MKSIEQMARMNGFRLDDSQQPEVLACQGEGGCTDSGLRDAGFLDIGKPNKNPSVDTFICPYWEWCNVKKVEGRDCGEDRIYCATEHFYNKYGENYLK